MKKLTAEQVMAIYNLEEKYLIHETKIQHSNGVTRVTIESVLNAEWDGPCGVDALLLKELDELFPDMEYMGPSAKCVNPMDGANEEIYYINWEDETLIWLIMRKRK